MIANQAGANALMPPPPRRAAILTPVKRICAMQRKFADELANKE